MKKATYYNKQTKLSNATPKRKLRPLVFLPPLIIIAALFCVIGLGADQNPNPSQAVAAVTTTAKFSGQTIDKSDKLLILVNPKTTIPKDYKIPSLKKLKNGQSVDSRCYPDLQKMMDDCRAAGYSPLICSSYRSQQKQQSLFTKKISQFKQKGYSQKDAEAEAAKIVAIPGTSEHQLGLAVDIVSSNNQNLDETQAKTNVQKWLMKNSWKYGFILRYPVDKSKITGIIYEPWHYRYVGQKAAKDIYNKGICLEEYLAQ